MYNASIRDGQNGIPNKREVCGARRRRQQTRAVDAAMRWSLLCRNRLVDASLAG
jgi:hypothetical protein